MKNVDNSTYCSRHRRFSLVTRLFIYSRQVVTREFYYLDMDWWKPPETPMEWEDIPEPMDWEDIPPQPPTPTWGEVVPSSPPSNFSNQSNLAMQPNAWKAGPISSQNVHWGTLPSANQSNVSNQGNPSNQSNLFKQTNMWWAGTNFSHLGPWESLRSSAESNLHNQANVSNQLNFFNQSNLSNQANKWAGPIPSQTVHWETLPSVVQSNLSQSNTSLVSNRSDGFRRGFK